MKWPVLRVLCGLVVLASGPAVEAQEPTPGATQTPTFRTGIDLVSIDVAVVDGRGLPVEDLFAPEFSVKIDGVPRRVVSAELVKVDLQAARKQAADKTETFYTSNLTPTNARQIIIAVDQVNIRPGALQPLMAAAGRFLDRLSPLDQVAFIAYPEPGPQVNFTNDKLKLRLAMQSLIGQPPRMAPGQHNVGATEALAIYNRRDQIVLTSVMERECRTQDPARLAQCERDITTEAAEIARRVREDADQSALGLRQLLERLRFAEGPKSLILISEGMAIDDQNELRSLVRLAGAARTSINIMAVDLRRGDVSVGEQPPSETQDRRFQMQGLESLATMSLGSLFYIAGTGEPIFDRLSSELSAHYLLGVEQRPSDREGDRHRIDIEVRRRNVTIRSRQAFVLSPTAGAKRSPAESLRDALSSPFGVSGLPLRVTTFSHQEPATGKVRLSIAAQIGQPGATKTDVTLGYLLVDRDNQIVSSYANAHTLEPRASGANEPLEFVGGVVVEPGIYSLRFGVVDNDGRRGSVVREVNAWKMAGETLALGDLIVGAIPEAGQALRAGVEPHVTTDTLAAHLELYSTAATTFDAATVTFEVADDADSPSLAVVPGQLAAGRLPTWRAATAAMGLRALPPGRYVARAKIVRGGTTVGILSRPFVLERPVETARLSSSAVTTASRSFASTLPAFDRNAVLQPDLVKSLLDVVDTRSPLLKDAMVEARAGRYAAAAIEALGAGDQAAAAFLKGVDLYAKGQFEPAAQQLNIAAGPRREFFPAALFLGASLAAAGRDRDAAGVWQLALAAEPVGGAFLGTPPPGTAPRPSAHPPIIYAMVADARLRDGQAQSAIDILRPAYERQPDDEIGRRLGMAYVLTARYAEAMPVLDAYLSRHAVDQDVLVAAVVAQYELVRAGQLLSNVDRAKVRRYAAAYKGDQRAIVDKYLETMQAK
jgi:VWFA-related protein